MTSTAVGGESKAEAKACVASKPPNMGPARCPWHFLTNVEVGEGAFGTVVPACCGDDCNTYVRKYVPFQRAVEQMDLPVMTPKAFSHEVETQAYCAGRDANNPICPPVVDWWLCKEGGILIMPFINVSLHALLLDTVGDRNLAQLSADERLVLANILADVYLLVKRFHNQVGLVHDDLHVENIMAHFDAAPAAAGARTPLETYLASRFRYRIIDTAKAQPLSADPKTRARQIAYDRNFLKNSILTLLKDHVHAQLADGEVVDLLEGPLTVLLATLDSTNAKDALIAAMRDETTFLDPDILQQPPEEETLAAQEDTPMADVVLPQSSFAAQQWWW